MDELADGGDWMDAMMKTGGIVFFYTGPESNNCEFTNAARQLDIIDTHTHLPERTSIKCVVIMAQSTNGANPNWEP